MKFIRIIPSLSILLVLFSCGENSSSTNNTGYCAAPYDAILTMKVNGRLVSYDARAILKNDEDSFERYLLVDMCGNAHTKNIPVLTFEKNGILLLEDYLIFPEALYPISDLGFGQFGHGGAQCLVPDENGELITYEMLTNLFYYADDNGDYTTNMGKLDLRSKLNYKIVQQYSQNGTTLETKCDVDFSGVLHRFDNHNDSIVITEGKVRY